MKDPNLKYMQVYNQLKKDLYTGKYPVGTLLPTESQLAEQFCASKSTIRHAIAMLIADKLVEVTQGRGAEVLPITAKPLQYNRFKGHTILSSGFTSGYENAAVTSSTFFIEKVSVSGIPCAELEVPDNTPFYKIQYFQMLGQIPFSYFTVYIPCSLAPELHSHASEIVRLYPFLMEKYGIQLTHTTETLTFGAANLIEARLLSVETSTPLIHSRRTTYSDDKRVLYSEAMLRADIMTMSLASDSSEYII